MEGYAVKINESSFEMSAKDRIKMKDTSDAIKLDVATTGAEVIINVAGYVVLDIHNEKSDSTDYKNYVIVDKDGQKFVTGSASFWSTFIGIFDEMAGVDEDWALKCYKLPSKNYKGKEFLTCSIM